MIKCTFTTIQCCFSPFLHHPFRCLSCNQVDTRQKINLRAKAKQSRNNTLRSIGRTRTAFAQKKLHIPLCILFFLALLLFLSACVSSVSSFMSPLPANTSSGASMAASETANGAIYSQKHEEIKLMMVNQMQ